MSICSNAPTIAWVTSSSEKGGSVWDRRMPRKSATVSPKMVS